MSWFFQTLSPAQVETEVTQRDQFSNDKVTLDETIVRESVQNSLDAQIAGEQVKVTFRWLDRSDGLDQDYFNRLLDQQPNHARSAGLKIDKVDFDKPRALVIEDFGTKGLTGKTDRKDDDNFSDFWRRHGKSHKSGKSRGRWGLGKLVYSTTSELGVFFGYTFRSGDSKPYLMGQSVLNLYTHQGKQYLPHSFFADQSDPGIAELNLPIPLRDTAAVNEFRDHFCLERRSQSGLSIVIPYPDRTFDMDSMIRIAIENYFYPIITQQLVLVFGQTEIKSNNIRELARRYSVVMYSNVDALFDFIEAASCSLENRLLDLRDSWTSDKRLSEQDFDSDDLTRMKEHFAAGELCGLRLPLTLRRRADDGKHLIRTYFTAFVQRPSSIQDGLDLYVRGGLTLPGECKFKSRRALGLMVAEDDSICDFLGDAENPAHTQWHLRPEKLKKKYFSPQDTVRVIKNILVNLYDLLAESEQEEDDKVLARFFEMSEAEQAGESAASKPSEGATEGKTPPSPDELPTRKQLVKIHSIDCGFAISISDEISDADLPVRYTFTAAYDDGSSNPLKNYNPCDFNFGKPGSIALSLVYAENSELPVRNIVETFEQNRLTVLIQRASCVINVRGFDTNRDLKVNAKKELIRDFDSPVGKVA